MPNEKPIPQQIPIEKIHDLPGVTDFKLPEKSYGTLVSSILVNGLREPVILRPLENGEYQLVHGYRRRKAAELAKLKTVDALVYDMTEKEAKEYRLAVAANPSALVPGKLIDADAKTPAANATPKEEKAEDKQSAKVADPQEKKAEPAEKKAEAAPPAPAKVPEEKPAEKKAESAATPAAKPEEKKSAEPPKPDKGSKAADQKEKKTMEAPAPAAEDKEKKPAPAKTPAKKAEKEEKPVGTVAEGRQARRSQSCWAKS